MSGFSRKLGCALLASSALIAPQIAKAATPAPQFTAIDQNGVDITTALPFVSIDEGGIGTGDGALRMHRTWAAGAGWADNWTGGLFSVTSGDTTKVYVQLSGMSDVFTQSGSTFTPAAANGSSLVILGNGDYLYTGPDGTTIEFLGTPFDRNDTPCAGADANTCRVPITITKPTGLKFNFTYDTGLSVFKRLAGVSSSAGYSLAITYTTNNAGTGSQPVNNWYQRTSVAFTNSANPPNPLPTITYDNSHANEVDVTDPAGRTWILKTEVKGGDVRLASIQSPGSGKSLTYRNATDGTVQSATWNGATTTYSRVINGTTATVTSTDALNKASVAVVDLGLGRLTSFTDPLNRTTSYQYDTNARLTRTTLPEGNYTQLDYDSRGNVTTTTQVAKAGSGLADVVSTASFDATCANIVTCNKPNSVTDAKNNVTDYTYDPTHGGVLTVTQPASTTGAVRPQTRYSYSQITGASGDLVYELTGVSACQTTSSCTGTSDETKKLIAYNSNLLPTTVSQGDGTGTLTATTTNTYYPNGDLNTADGPLPGTADMTKYHYDAVDELIGIVGPDPDGAGPMKMRATRITYRPDGQISKKELGTVNSQSDADWTLFAPLQTLDTLYDASSRKQTEKLSAGGTVYAITDYDYDADARPTCAAVRMNGTSLASACTLTAQGSFGPDRIAQNVYDDAGQITQIKVAVGTSDAATERTMTYSNNGKLATLKDANDNLTTYEYDGFDRLSKTRYPDQTKGSGTSSTTDYEQLTYDANSNVVSHRLRDGNAIAFTFDNLNRTTLKDLPGSEPDVSYGYDNLGRTISASETGNALSFTHDALGRKLTETGPLGTVTSQYDLAGRRTQITYPGSGLFVNYDYLVTGETAAVRENGAVSGIGVLASYSYDDLGNRISVTFGNGATQSFGRDPVSRLLSLTNDLSGTTNDLSASFSYNPASQIMQTVRTGDVYAWDGAVNVNRSYTSNGLNQYLTAGSATFGYDAKGNLTSDGTTAFCYSSENLLTGSGGTCAGPSVSLSYDPQLRLYQVAGGSTSRFAYDGLNIVADYDQNNLLLHRYVFGPGMDQPIVEYAGSGTTNRMFLSADERGSIVARTDSAGALISINAYDEYGIPKSSNAGLFQYTGQAWITQLGMYYYKARIYSPTLGRFLETDPIGYGDGPNSYAGMHNDPINGVDPSGKDVMYYCQGGGVYTSAQAHAPDAHGSLPDLENCAQVPVSDPPSNPFAAPIDAGDNLIIGGLLTSPAPTNNVFSRSGTYFSNPSPSPSVGGELSYGILNPIDMYSLRPMSNTLVVTTYSINVVQEEGGLVPIPFGAIAIDFYHCLGCSPMPNGAFAAVNTLQRTITEISIPSGAGYVGVGAVVNTPEATTYRLQTKPY